MSVTIGKTVAEGLALLGMTREQAGIRDHMGTAGWVGNVYRIVVYGTPMGKPRMTQRDRWAKRGCVMRYRDWADRIREVAGLVPAAESVLSLDWVATFEPPRSWSKKKRLAYIGQLHRAKPDKDNIEKGLLDALFPNSDCAIADGRGTKKWGWRSGIGINITVEVGRLTRIRLERERKATLRDMMRIQEFPK